ncbi:hypothetical protein VTN00DRAFT_4000 [Thermoascus crustaceus]|uniref:uncharacterized protein n=1 Tax=Thermoascus crustaceus TaxID=5088 RepID=UPI0037423544
MASCLSKNAMYSSVARPLSGRILKSDSWNMSNGSKTYPKRVTFFAGILLPPRSSIYQMGRSIYSGCRPYRKGPQKKPFRVLEISITQNERQDDDIFMNDVPMHTRAFCTTDPDVRRWSIVEEELVHMMEALKLISQDEDLPEPQFVHLERRPPRSRVPCTLWQAQELQKLIDRINSARDVLKEKERRRRQKDVVVIQIIERNIPLLQRDNTGAASPKGLEHVKDAEHKHANPIRHVKHVEYVKPVERVSHVKRAQATTSNPLRAPRGMTTAPGIVISPETASNKDVIHSANPLRNPEIVASPEMSRAVATCGFGSVNPLQMSMQKQNSEMITSSAAAKVPKVEKFDNSKDDPTSNITPKVIPLDAKCPARNIHPDHVAAANIPVRLRSRPETPLLKKLMLKNLSRNLTDCARKINESRQRPQFA